MSEPPNFQVQGLGPVRIFPTEALNNGRLSGDGRNQVQGSEACGAVKLSSNSIDRDEIQAASCIDACRPPASWRVKTSSASSKFDLAPGVSGDSKGFLVLRFILIYLVESEIGGLQLEQVISRHVTSYCVVWLFTTTSKRAKTTKGVPHTSLPDTDVYPGGKPHGKKLLLVTVSLLTCSSHLEEALASRRAQTGSRHYHHQHYPRKQADNSIVKKFLGLEQAKSAALDEPPPFSHSNSRRHGAASPAQHMPPVISPNAMATTQKRLQAIKKIEDR
ncbi:hypothetical protein EV421DRAFT_1741627 [Armillaria borealis]|uniref:Uncharacterized protein n=1 Tax=Armillaria borealis TaxID=47425 RepID=A0AA39IZE3_9AGAR|nr:hypothetical protein EV421DRAFT_1741627 [Armillaria borealis]